MNNLKKAIAIVIVIVIAACSTSTHNIPPQKKQNSRDDAVALYNEMGLTKTIPQKAFIEGYKVATNLPLFNGIIVIIDFTKHSAKERFYVIDIHKKELLYSTHVSHGMNSGKGYANKFSNDLGSNKSSLGHYLTNETYVGKNGCSLRLDGMTKGLNHNLRIRYIALHPSHYANPEFIEVNKILGRSDGCLAIPQKVSKEIIDLIKGGTVIYAFHDGVSR